MANKLWWIGGGLAALFLLKKSGALDGISIPRRGWHRMKGKRPMKKFCVDADRVCFRTKTDTLIAFKERNQHVIDAYGGEDAVHRPSEFDALNEELGLTGKRRVQTVGDAIWHSLQGGPPWCMGDINIDLLNRTTPGRRNRFEFPDEVHTKAIIRAERERIGPEPQEDIPF